MFENIRLSFQGIWSHKMRSFLTMLGIIIGIAAIIAIVSTIKGTNKQIEQNLIGSGDNNVKVLLYNGDWALDMGYEEVPDSIPVIGKNTIEEMKEIDGVEKLSVYRSRQESNVYRLNNSFSGYVNGIDDSYFGTCGYVIKSGRGFTEQDYTEAKKVAILDENSSEALFQGEDPIGKTIELRDEPFVVVGVVAEMQSFEPVINSQEDYYTYANATAGALYVPDAIWPIIYQYDEPQSVLVKASSTDTMAKSGKGVADILNSYITGDTETVKYKSEDLLEQAKQIQQLSASTNTMLIWIAGISLLVGGIGVMNIMLVSVTERTSEIGLKKAIGARKGVIMGQFLTEAVVLTSLGGLIGVIVGIILAEVISKINTTPVAISVPAAIFAVAFSMVIGILFGLLPSYKAANLDPIEALRRE